eukprot:5825412-Prymnesium_polylepis.1
MSHLCTSCAIGLAYHGKHHPNSERKLRELHELLTNLGLQPFAVAVRDATTRDDLLRVREALDHILRMRLPHDDEVEGEEEEEEG